jgi:hypothetical protein
LSNDSVVIRNVGFVNCEWILKGKLKRNEESKLYTEGRTYDGKLYTFKEAEYKKVFENLHILVKPVKD